MIGFVIGTACLIGLIKVLRGHRYHHGWHQRAWHGHGGGCGCGPGFGGPRGFGRGRFDEDLDGFPGDPSDQGPPVMLRGLFARLQTSPGQERTILEALRELKVAARAADDERAKSARQVAEALRGDEFRTENMGEAFSHLETGAEALRDAAFAALAKIHAVLDERQRRLVADLVGRGANVLEHLAAQA
ncbi:MAG: hypothetical protein IT383_08905 [Deltaproteobacteria bacterium]|nr:hypothetical protein [Deltaproteobacteria bacterium]